MVSDNLDAAQSLLEPKATIYLVAYLIQKLHYLSDHEAPYNQFDC